MLKVYLAVSFLALATPFAHSQFTKEESNIWKECKKIVEGENRSIRMKCHDKCVSEKNGIVDSEGKVNSDKLLAIPVFKKLSDLEKKEVKKCLENVPPIKQCEDMDALNPCREIIFKQENANMKECMNKTEVTMEDLRSLDKIYKDKKEVPLKIKCYFKCFFEKIGSIDSDGIVNFEKFTDVPFFLSSSQKKEVKKCIESIPPVKKCEDIDALNTCKEIMFKHHFQPHDLECANKSELSVQDLGNRHNMNKDKDLQLKFRCYRKCITEKSGAIDGEGKVNLKQITATPRFKKLSDAEKENVTKCLERLSPITNCEEIKTFQNCKAPMF